MPSELDGILERQDEDGSLSTKFHNNRCFLRKTIVESGEVSYTITNTTECLSAEDGVRERRYNTLTLSPLAIVPLFDVISRLIESGDFHVDADQHLYALNFNHNKYKEAMEVEK